MLKAKILGFEVVYAKKFTHLDGNALNVRIGIESTVIILIYEIPRQHFSTWTHANDAQNISIIICLKKEYCNPIPIINTTGSRT